MKLIKIMMLALISTQALAIVMPSPPSLIEMPLPKNVVGVIKCEANRYPGNWDILDGCIKRHPISKDEIMSIKDYFERYKYRAQSEIIGIFFDPNKDEFIIYYK